MSLYRIAMLAAVLLVITAILAWVVIDPEPSPTISVCIKSRTVMMPTTQYNPALKIVTTTIQPRKKCLEREERPNPRHERWLARRGGA